MRLAGTALCAAALFSLARASPAGPDDAVREFQTEWRRIDVLERAFWDGFSRRKNAAHARWMAPWLKHREDTERLGHVPTLYVDPGGFAELHDEFRGLTSRRGDALDALARSGDARASGMLLGRLVGLGDAVDAADEDLRDAKPSGGWGWCDQEPAVRRDGLGLLEARLVAAVGACPGGGEGELERAWPDAVRRDGARSIVRRAALVDAASARKDRGFLVARFMDVTASVRIAAVEGLAALDAAPAPPLANALEDRSSLVRRTLLAALDDRPGSVAWVPSLLGALGRREGTERAEVVAALRRVSGASIGDDVGAWGRWLEANAALVAAGKRPPARPDSPTAAESAEASSVDVRPEFYGARTSSHGIVFVLDGTDHALVPADVEIQRTRPWMEWLFGPQGWQREHETHHQVQQRELRGTLEALPEQARFGIVLNEESASVRTLGERGLLRADRRSREKAVEFLASHAPRGFRGELANLETAMELAGLAPDRPPGDAEPLADTVFLLADGSNRGGRYLVVDAAIRAFVRLNRFRRVVVHTVRICDAGPDAERLLTSIATSSGGTHRWSRKPPR